MKSIEPIISAIIIILFSTFMLRRSAWVAATWVRWNRFTRLGNSDFESNQSQVRFMAWLMLVGGGAAFVISLVRYLAS